MNIINNYVNIYYIMIIGYSLYFIVLSFTELPDLPWQFCKKEWESKKNSFWIIFNQNFLIIQFLSRLWR